MPHEGVPGSTPMPRKLSAASARTAPPQAPVAMTMMMGMTLGKTCLIRILISPAPIAREASTKVLVFTTIVSARNTRDPPMKEKIAIAMISVLRLWPNTAMSMR